MSLSASQKKRIAYQKMIKGVACIKRMDAYDEYI